MGYVYSIEVRCEEEKRRKEKGKRGKEKVI